MHQTLCYTLIFVYTIYTYLYNNVYICIGKKMVECILEGTKWPKSLPKVTDKEQAVLIGEVLLRAAMFHRSEKLTEQKKAMLVVSSMCMWWCRRCSSI